MSGPVWQRISAPLIELSLTNTEAPARHRRWELRLEGTELEIKLLDDDGENFSTIRLSRIAPDEVSFEQTIQA